MGGQPLDTMDSFIMSLGPLVVEIVVVCCITAVILHRYSNWRKQHIITTIAVFISWYFSFLIIVILPLDVSNTYYRQCLVEHSNLPTVRPTDIEPENVTVATTVRNSSSTDIPSNISDNVAANLSDLNLDSVCAKPWSYIPPRVLPIVWRVIYWTSQSLTWLVLPMMQSYSQAGDFSVAGKLKSALIANAIYYGTYLLIFGVCLIYVAIRPDIHVDGSQLKVLAITASNTWGLFLLVLLLGYGLVDVPRRLWNNAKRGYQLNLTYFKIAKLSVEKSEAEESLEDVLDDVKKAADTIKYNNALRKHVDTVLLKCPESVQNSVKRNMDDYEDYNNPTETPTEKSLVRLHTSVIKASQNYRRTQCQWNLLVDQALELEDVAVNEVNVTRTFRSSFSKYEGIFRHCYSPKIEWYWKCMLRPWVLRFGCVLLAIMTFMVVWSECLFFVASPTLSIFAVFVDLAKQNYQYIYIELACGLTMAYLASAAYSTVFKIRIFNFYYLASHHQTNEYSLIFCGMLLCRLTPPMCLNFLGLIHLDSHVTKRDNLQETAYTQIMGHMDVISFIANGFNIYFPMLILLLCIATYLRLGSRVLTFFGFQQFMGDCDMTQELVDEGKELVKRERRRLQRKEEGEARRRYWTERFGDSDEQYQRRGTRGDEPPTTRSRPGVPSTDVRSFNNPNPHPPGKYVPFKKREENDRMELLQQAEPIDFTPDGNETYDDFTNTYTTYGGTSNYQSQGGRSTRFGTAPKGPPTGIFDDI